MIQTSLSDLKILDLIKNHIFDSNTYQEMCQKNNIDPNIIFYSPMAFADLDVSARTQHGIIYFNSKLKNNPQEIDHYMIHEFTHVIQQCFGDEPTQGSNDSDDYLENPFEVEGFNNQTSYITEDEGPHKAEEYIDKVLHHHDVPKHQKNNKKEKLLDTSLSDDKKYFEPLLQEEIWDVVKKRPYSYDMLPSPKQKQDKQNQLSLFDDSKLEAQEAAKEFRDIIIDQTKPSPYPQRTTHKISPARLSDKSKQEIQNNIKNIQLNIDNILSKIKL
jgi:hypothetical protein